MEKLVRDGRVAVLVSGGFGAGWSSWNSDKAEAMLFDKRLVLAFEEGGAASVIEKFGEIWPDDYVCTLGSAGLEIEWVPEGRLFYVHEYDGSEHLVFEDAMRRA